VSSKRIAAPTFLLALSLSLLLVGHAHAQMLPPDGFVPVPGGRVAFRVVGKGDGVPMLIIHGGPGGTSCSYAGTTSGVANSRPVVMYDQLGAGNSDRMTDLPRDAVLSRFVAEVVAVRAQLGLKEVHLVGHSWGATVALEYLLTAKPQGVRSVSFVGPLLSTPLWIEDAKALVKQLSPESQTAIEAAVASGAYDTPAFKAADKNFAENFGRRSEMTAEKRELVAACSTTPTRFNDVLYKYMWGPSEFVANGTLRDYDRMGRLHELKLPTMFMAGEFDEARPSTMLKFQALVSGSIVKIIPNAGHSVFVDQTKAVNDALSEFMKDAEQR
jgi:proline iminopeptidase